MPIKIAQILEATTGGTRRHLVDLVTHLDAREFDVTVICATLRDKGFRCDIDRMQAHGAHVHVVQMVRAIHPPRDLAALARIYRLLKRGRYDVVHTHSAKAGFLGRLAARMARVPTVIHTPHGFPFQMDVGPFRRAIYRSLERFAARYTDTLVCVSAEERDLASRLSLLPRQRIRLIANGVAPLTQAESQAPAVREQLAIPDTCTIVGTVGRYTRQKGLDCLLNASVPVLQKHPDTRFLLVGDGEDKGKLERLARRLGVSDRILFVGYREDVHPLLQVMDVFVLPSLWEGLPYAIIEAMQMGKAVVATNVGGARDAIWSTVSGLLVPPGSSDYLADAICDLLADPDRRRQLGLTAAEFAATHYRLDTMVARLADLYRPPSQRVAG